MSVPAGLRREVTRRAGNRCEYCRLAQAGQEAAFHVDHVHPVAEGGGTVPENPALACVSCSLRKGARRLARDPLTGKAVLPSFIPAISPGRTILSGRERDYRDSPPRDAPPSVC